MMNLKKALPPQWIPLPRDRQARHSNRAELPRKTRCRSCLPGRSPSRMRPRRRAPGTRRKAMTSSAIKEVAKLRLLWTMMTIRIGSDGLGNAEAVSLPGIAFPYDDPRAQVEGDLIR